MAGTLLTHPAAELHAVPEPRGVQPQPVSSEDQLGAEPKPLMLDASDLAMLIDLARATNVAEARQRAARVAALLGPDAPQASELIEALIARTIDTQRLKCLAGTDELTGIGNRRAFGEALRRELARAGRARTCIALVLCDVDGLKVINDHLGHAAGDRALRTVARCLRRGTRDGDLVARLGEDEFGVMLPMTGALAAGAVAMRMREALAEAGGTEMSVGVSVGIAVTQGGDLDALGLIAAADAALYRDKAARKACALPT